MDFLLNVHRYKNKKIKLFSLGPFQADSIEEAKRIACNWIDKYHNPSYAAPSMWKPNYEHNNSNQWLIRDKNWDKSFCLTLKS